jgi:hypothetical protein
MPDEQVFEMLWDCPACGTRKLLARTNRACPNCGSPQDPAWRYFPAEGEATAVANPLYVGADVICPNCQTPNSKNANFCVNCSAPLQNAKTVRTFGEQTRAEGSSFAEEDLRARRRAEKDAARGVQPAAQARRGPPLALIVVVLIAVFAGVIWAFSLTRNESVTVAGATWQRSIQVQRFQPVAGSAWCDSLPFGAYNVNSFQAQRSTRSVPDGQTCQVVRRDRGDGTFSQRRECSTRYRQEPIYDRRCNFVLNTWTNARVAAANGSGQTPAPFWPQNFLTNPGVCLGCEREGARAQTLQLRIQRSRGDDVTCTVPEDVWQRSTVGTKLSVRVGRLVGDVRCDSIQFSP